MKEATELKVKDCSKKFNVLGKKSLARMIDRSVAKALRAHVAGQDVTVEHSIRKDVRRDFLALMDSSKSVRGQSKSSFLKELEGSRKQILKERAAAEREVESLRKAMEVLKGSSAENARLAAATEQQSKVHDDELAEKIREMFGDIAEGQDLADLQDKIIELASGATRDQRKRLHEAKAEDSADKVSLLERRIAKLSKSLEDSESALKNLAKIKNVDTGIASIYDTIQGLNDDDGNFEAKKEMLGAIFQANFDLQKRSA